MPFKRKCVKIEADGIMYNSMQEAANAIGCKLWNISDAFKSGKNTWQGHTFKRFDGKYSDVAEKRKNRKNGRTENQGRKGCKVVCTTTGEIFDTITKAADHCGIINWTLGLNLAKYGKYIDKKGNIYIKQSSMNDTKKVSKVIKERIEAKSNNTSTSNNKFTSTLNNIKSNSKLSESDEKALSIVTSNLIRTGQYNEATVLLNILRNKA